MGFKHECRFICQAFDGTKGRPLYGYGEKYCALCEYVFRSEYAGVFCPCCGSDLKFKNEDQREFYKDEHYSEGFKALIEKRVKKQCSWCLSYVSKHALHRVVGKEKEPGAMMYFWQEWRSDSTGAPICYDCYRTMLGLQTLDKHLTQNAEKFYKLELDIPDAVLGKLRQVFELYKPVVPLLDK